jgi:hypothetical protein
MTLADGTVIPADVAQQLALKRKSKVLIKLFNLLLMEIETCNSSFYDLSLTSDSAAQAGRE